MEERLASHRLWLERAPGGLRAEFRGATLSDLKLDGVDLRQADLHGASFLESSLTGANLAGANLSGADLRKVNLIDADLSTVTTQADKLIRVGGTLLLKGGTSNGGQSTQLGSGVVSG